VANRQSNNDTSRTALRTKPRQRNLTMYQQTSSPDLERLESRDIGVSL
jgi:hypothetical protein